MDTVLLNFDIDYEKFFLDSLDGDLTDVESKQSADLAATSQKVCVGGDENAEIFYLEIKINEK